MFRKIRLGRQAYKVLADQFNYDLTTATPHQFSVFNQIVTMTYAANGGNPTDVAVLYMMMQINALRGEERTGVFPQHIMALRKQLEPALTPNGRRALNGAIDTFSDLTTAEGLRRAS